MSIEIRNLSKQYAGSKHKSLSSVDLNLSSGIFGLIGENGAGKSTLLKILSTQIAPSSGEIRFLGNDPAKEMDVVRGLIGYLPQNVAFFNHLTAFEMMDYMGLLKNMDSESQRKQAIYHLLMQFNLYEKKNEKIKHLSGGMKQRLGIAQSLLADPKVVILDEPTVGLDPSERLRFRNIISDISKDKIVIVSTHIISDIAMMGNQLAILKKGNLLYSGYTQDLLEDVTGKVFVLKLGHDEKIDDKAFGDIIAVSRKKDYMEVRFTAEKAIEDAIAVEPTLEDAYFYVNSVKGRDVYEK